MPMVCGPHSEKHYSSSRDLLSRVSEDQSKAKRYEQVGKTEAERRSDIVTSKLLSIRLKYIKWQACNNIKWQNL